MIPFTITPKKKKPLEDTNHRGQSTLELRGDPGAQPIHFPDGIFVVHRQSLTHDKKGVRGTLRTWGWTPDSSPRMPGLACLLPAPHLIRMVAGAQKQPPRGAGESQRRWPQVPSQPGRLGVPRNATPTTTAALPPRLPVQGVFHHDIFLSVWFSLLLLFKRYKS